MYIEQEYVWTKPEQGTATHKVTLTLIGKQWYHGVEHSKTLYRLKRSSAVLLSMKGEQNIKPRLRDYFDPELWDLNQVETTKWKDLCI